MVSLQESAQKQKQISPQMHTDEERTVMERNIVFINGLTEQIIGCSFKVLNTLGAGFLEKV